MTDNGETRINYRINIKLREFAVEVMIFHLRSSVSIFILYSKAFPGKTISRIDPLANLFVIVPGRDNKGGPR